MTASKVRVLCAGEPTSETMDRNRDLSLRALTRALDYNARYKGQGYRIGNTPACPRLLACFLPSAVGVVKCFERVTLVRHFSGEFSNAVASAVAVEGRTVFRFGRSAGNRPLWLVNIIHPRQGMFAVLVPFVGGVSVMHLSKGVSL